MNPLEPVLRSLAGWVLTTSWQVAILIVLVIAAQWALRKYLTPRWRYALWFLVLARMVLPTLPESPFSLYNIVPSADTVVSTATTGFPLDYEPIRDSVTSEVPAQRTASSQIREPMPVAQTTVSSSPAFERADSSAAFSKFWFLGLLLLFAFGVGQMVTTHLWCSRLPAVTDSRILQVLDECKKQVGVQEAIQIVEAPRTNAPALMGTLNPTLLLPSGMVASIGHEKLRFVLLHELSHIKRRDIWVNSLTTLLCVLHWFNPLVWYAVRRMRADQELACDALALSYTRPGESRHYGETVVQLLEHTANPQRLPGMAGILEDKSQMRRRIQMIVDFKKPGPAWSVVTVVLVVAMGLCTLTEANTNTDEISAPSGERTITFPQDRSVGTLLMREWGSDDEGAWESLGEAMGEVYVPEGMEVLLDTKKDRKADLSFLSGLPPDALQGLDLERTSATDSDISPLAAFSTLRILNLNRTGITGGGIATVTNLTSLETLFLRNLALGNTGVEHLRGLVNLRNLELEGTGITHQGVPNLAGLQNLERLRLVKNNINGDGLSALANLRSLKELYIHMTDLSDTGLEHVGKLTWLEKLDLWGDPITDLGLSHLSAMESLKWLGLGDTGVGSGGLRHLTTLRNLETLILDKTAVDDSGIPHIAAIPSLRFVRLAQTEITTQGVAQLENHPSLFQFWKARNPEAPTVGVLFTLARATRSQGYLFAGKLTAALKMNGFNVVPVIEPGCEDSSTLQTALLCYNMSGDSIMTTDTDRLRDLDVIAGCHNPAVEDQTVNSILEAVRNGVGFFHKSVFSLWTPGYTEEVRQLLGVEDGQYVFGPTPFRCAVLTAHPILGIFEPGDAFRISCLNGYIGVVDGQTLLGSPEGGDEDFCPLIARQVGEGRVVACQWLDVTDNPPYSNDDFIARCVNWAAKKDAGAKWSEVE